MLRNHGGVSIFSTGRPFEQVLSDPLLQNYPVDYIMSGVGTELYQNINGEYVIDEEFTHYILMPDNDKEPFNPINIDSRIKDNLFLQKIGIKKHHGVPFSEVICGYSVPFADEIDEKKLQMALTEAMEEIDFKAIVYPNTHSRRYNIDILPSKAGKDGATKWLIPRMKSEGKIIDAAIIAGDSGNDIPAMNPALYQNLGINHVTIVGSPNSQEAVVKYLNNISEESGVNVIYDRAQEQKNAQFIAEAIDSTVLAYNSKSTPFSVLSNNSRSEWNGKVASFAPCQHYG
jgi:hydroxymethylpyrimidine pyrophosphatase-like HAD family hydrolase